MKIKMNPLLNVVIMIIASIFIGYFLTMTIILRSHKTNNRNKIYQSLLMGLWMGLVELLMVGIVMKMWIPGYTILLLLLLLGIAILSYLVYYQVGITATEFMLGMQEHHAMAIAMAKQVRPKVTDQRLLDIVDNIIQSQQSEIDQMQQLLNE